MFLAIVDTLISSQPNQEKSLERDSQIFKKYFPPKRELQWRIVAFSSPDPDWSSAPSPRLTSSSSGPSFPGRQSQWQFQCCHLCSYAEKGNVNSKVKVERISFFSSYDNIYTHITKLLNTLTTYWNNWVLLARRYLKVVFDLKRWLKLL